MLKKQHRVQIVKISFLNPRERIFKFPVPSDHIFPGEEGSILAPRSISVIIAGDNKRKKAD